MHEPAPELIGFWEAAAHHSAHPLKKRTTENMATFPKDQFDDLPADLQRVGAHRGPRARGAGLIVFAWALVATLVIVIGALYFLSRSDPSLQLNPFAAPTAASTPTAKPTQITVPATDANAPDVKKRKITVTVLNGTSTDDLQSKAATAIKKAHWKVVTTAVSSSTSVKITTVYYADAANKDVALGIAQSLGFNTVVQSSLYQGSKITVVVGADY